MGLEAVGLGALIPILTLVLNPEKLLAIAIVNDFFSRFNISSTKDLIGVALALLLGIYLIKVLFQVFLSYIQNRFLSNFTRSVFYRLYNGYTNQPYAFHVQRNTSEFIKNLQVEINGFMAYLTAMLGLMTEIGLALAITVTLIYIEPVGAVGILLFFLLASGLFYQVFRKKLARWGTLRIRFEETIAKLVLETFNGIKDIKILGRVGFFRNSIAQSLIEKYKITIKQATLVQVPRFYLELVSVLALVVFIFLMVVQGKDTAQLMMTLGVFVAATFRMIPTMNKILVHFQNLKFYRASVQLLFKEFQGFENIPEIAELHQPLPFKKQIEIQDIHFRYTLTSVPVLQDLSLTIPRGSSVGIMGVSGSGKSTLVDVLCGLYAPDRGEILIDSIPLENATVVAWQKNIGYVPQHIFLSDDSIAANVAFGLPKADMDRKRIREVLGQAQLRDFVVGLPKGIETRVGEHGVQLSGGQRQRVGIARALYHNPEVLILDEATSALDTETETQFLATVKALKGEKTLLIIAHRKTTLTDCDRVYRMEAGRLSAVKAGVIFNH